MKKNLVIYFSRSGMNYVNGEIVNLPTGNTKLCAESIAYAVDASIFEVEKKDPYPDLYKDCVKEAKLELQNRARPPLKQQLNDISAYENIFVCGPCWWSSFPMPLFSQLEKLDFSGKNLWILVTNEGSGIGDCVRDTLKICRGANFVNSLAVLGHDCNKATTKAHIQAWAIQELKSTRRN